jgi:hypothetical protein
MTATAGGLLTDPDSLSYTLATVNSTNVHTTELTLDTTNQLIQLTRVGNLTADGVTLQCLYSKLKEIWVTDSSLRPLSFPINPITNESFELINGWNFDANINPATAITINSCSISNGQLAISTAPLTQPNLITGNVYVGAFVKGSAGLVSGTKVASVNTGAQTVNLDTAVTADVASTLTFYSGVDYTYNLVKSSGWAVKASGTNTSQAEYIGLISLGGLGAQGENLTLTLAANCNPNTSQYTVSDTTALIAGSLVNAPYLPYGSYIVSIDSPTLFTVNKNFTRANTTPSLVYNITIRSTQQPYYQIGANSSVAGINTITTGQVNQPIQVYGIDSNFNGPLDIRTVPVAQLILRVPGWTYEVTTKNDVGISSFIYQAYRFVLTNNIDTNIIDADTVISSDGTTLNTPYNAISITWNLPRIFTALSHSNVYVNGSLVTSGTGATFNVTTTNTAGYFGISVNNVGKGYMQNDQVKILGTQLNGKTPANDIVMTVTSLLPIVSGALTANTAYTSLSGTSVGSVATYSFISQKSTSGTGSGATFIVNQTALGSTYTSLNTTITAYSRGNSYALGDTVTISGSKLGGSDGTNDLTFTLSNYVNTNTVVGAIESFTNIGLPPMTRIINGTRRNFGVIIDADTSATGTYGKPTAIQLYEYVQWALRRTYNIDANVSIPQFGYTTRNLLEYRGSSLYTLWNSTDGGVYVDHINANDNNTYYYYDNTRTVVNNYYISQGAIIFNTALDQDYGNGKYALMFNQINSGNVSLTYGKTNAAYVKSVSVDPSGDGTYQIKGNLSSGVSSIAYNFAYENNTQAAWLPNNQYNVGDQYCVFNNAIGISSWQWYQVIGSYVSKTVFDPTYDTQYTVALANGPWVILVTQGLNNATFANVSGNIAKSTTNTITTASSTERNYA